MSIVGGAVLTKLQGGLITNCRVHTSFWLPASCFVMIALYGLHCFLAHDKSDNNKA
jgi:FHS family L-fucose permease-like MFS transporter